jgi:hypothetical protein
MNFKRYQHMITDNPKDPRLTEGQKNETGQHEIYLVLSAEERAKGFIRPVRRSYVHVGRFLHYTELVEMLSEGHDFFPDYAARMKVVSKDGKSNWVELARREELEAWQAGRRLGGCGGVTTMGQALAETYAREPSFYWATFCSHCNKHFLVSEFFWDGTTETVGS